jgi:hypothetical protein
MSQSTRVPRGATAPHGRPSATTAEGLAGQRAVLAARSRGKMTARITGAARRLQHAARADARVS